MFIYIQHFGYLHSKELISAPLGRPLHKNNTNLMNELLFPMKQMTSNFRDQKKNTDGMAILIVVSIE